MDKQEFTQRVLEAETSLYRVATVSYTHLDVYKRQE